MAGLDKERLRQLHDSLPDDALIRGIKVGDFARQSRVTPHEVEAALSDLAAAPVTDSARRVLQPARWRARSCAFGARGATWSTRD